MLWDECWKYNLEILLPVLTPPPRLPRQPSLELREFDLQELEKSLGLLQVSDALTFLHRDAGIIHRTQPCRAHRQRTNRLSSGPQSLTRPRTTLTAGNLTPDNIMVTKKGEWKLGGFHFCTFTKYQTEEGGAFVYPEHETMHANSPVYRAVRPDLDFLAPGRRKDQRGWALAAVGDTVFLSFVLIRVYRQQDV